MRRQRRTTRHVRTITAVTGLLVGSLLAAPAAQAAPRAAGTYSAAADLAAGLGDSHTAGAYVDQATGRPVVTVTDAAAARTVRAAGLTPRLVARSTAGLERATAGVRGDIRATGTSWLVDPVLDRIVVLADDTVSDATLGRVTADLRPLGDAVAVRRTGGTLGVRMSGGDPIFGSQYRCSAGVNVVSGGTYYFLTAGHCGNIESSWFTASGDYIGATAGSHFPGDDYAIVEYLGDVPAEGTIGSQDVTTAGNPLVGETVCMRGGVSGVHCGSVTGLNATVNYAEGVVSGLIVTNVCAEPGDSGSPLYDGTKVIGILSGSSGDCTNGGTSYFQPVTEALSMFGVSVY